MLFLEKGKKKGGDPHSKVPERKMKKGKKKGRRIS